MALQDDSWSFSAPQYVDFTAPEPTDDDADKWFDVNDDGQEIKEEHFVGYGETENIRNLLSDQKENSDPEQGVNKLTDDKVIKKENGDENKLQEKFDDEKLMKKKPGKILTPEEWYGKKPGESKTNCNAGTAQRVLKSAPVRQSPRLNANSENNSMKRVSSTSNLHTRRNSMEGAKKILKKADSQSKLKRSSSLRTKSCNKSQVNGTTLRRGSSTERLVDQTADIQKKPKITMPMTPKFMKRKTASVGVPRVVKNSEEQELEKIAELQRQMVQRRKLAEVSLKKLKEGGAAVPVIKGRGDKSIEQEHKVQNRVKGFFSNIKDKMRSTSSSKETEKEQNKQSVDNTKFESMAERILNFQKGTPERFHTRAKDRCKGLKRLRSNSKSPQKVKLTMPQTPNLQCTRRNRPIRVPSHQQLEEKEIEEMRKNQFHARPVNTKILEQTTGVKQIAKKSTTKVEGFNLSSDKRVKDRETTKSYDDDKFVFHAQPVNNKILEGVVGVKPAKGIPATVPQSPAFALKNRVRLPVEIPDDKHDKIHRARHVPHYGLPFQPKISHKTTVTQPFSFENRDRERTAKKEAKIQQVLDDEQKEAVRILRSRPVPHVGVPFNPKLTHKKTIPEPFSFEEETHQMELRRAAKRQKIFKEEKKAREFHAQPMPQLDEPVGIPEKQSKKYTMPVPFEFEVDFRSSRRAEDTQSRNEEDMLSDDKTVFKAKPVTVIYQEPFVPKKSTKPLTDVSDFELFTERRAAERESFEMYKKHKEADIEAQKRQKEHDELEAEKERIAHERQETVHKANPIRSFAAVKIHHSDKPLTKAESPQFSDRFNI